jgi:hypothetical protein
MTYSPAQKVLIEAALARLNLWPKELRGLPQPLAIATGVAGESQVYLFRLPNDGNDQTLGLVAKFENDFDRAKKEWAAINELRNEFRQFQRGLLLPIDGNNEADSVILFLLAGQDRPGMECVSLLKVFQKQLAEGVGNCRTALEQTVEVLHSFHWNAKWTDSAADMPQQTWRDIFKLDASVIQASLETLRQTGIIETGFRIRGQLLADPSTQMVALGESFPGWCKRGRIHGDLNLTNILCLLDEARKCWATYIIDFSHSRPEMPVALDYAKVEVELWQNVLHALDSEGDLALLTVNILGYLERRIPLFPKETSPSVINFLAVLSAWRNTSFKVLGAGVGARYMLKDYLICVFFHSIRALQWPDVQKAHQKVLVLAIVASHVARTLLEIEAGRYSSSSVDQFPLAPEEVKVDQSVWHEIPQAAVPSAIKSRGEADPYEPNLFTRRREIERAIPNLEKTIPLLVLGCRGAGKSWAIGHIARSLSKPVPGRRIIDLNIRLFPRRPSSTHGDLSQWLIHSVLERLAIGTNGADEIGSRESHDETGSSLTIRTLATRFSGRELYLLLDNADSIVIRSFAEIAGHFYRQMAGWKSQFEIQGKRLCIALASAKDPDHIESIIGLSIFHGAHRCILRDLSEEQIIELASSCKIVLTEKQARTIRRLTGGRPAHVAGVIGDVLAGDLIIKQNISPKSVPYFTNTLRPQLQKLIRDPAIRGALREIEAGKTDGLDLLQIHDLENEGLVRSNGSDLELSNEFVRALI